MDSATHSFIVKIWLEETVTEDGRVLWRGHITHVPSGERRYFEDLESISGFIRIYLRRYGAECDKSTLFQRRLKAIKAFWKQLFLTK